MDIDTGLEVARYNRSHEAPNWPACLVYGPRMTETQAIEEVDRHLRQGEPLLAYNAVQEGLALWPQNLRLRQLKGLATARSGDTERANKLLRELADAGHADAETLGILARTHKDLALRASDAAGRGKHLAAAFGIYVRKSVVGVTGFEPVTPTSRTEVNWPIYGR